MRSKLSRPPAVCYSDLSSFMGALSERLSAEYERALTAQRFRSEDLDRLDYHLPLLERLGIL